MIRVNQVKIKTGHTMEQLRKKTAELLRVSVQDIEELQIIRQSIDARKKPELFYSYVLDVQVKNQDRVLRVLEKKLEKKSEKKKEKNGAGSQNSQIGQAESVSYAFPQPGSKLLEAPVVIVGTGPAGLFCGYYLALQGYCPILLERGEDVDRRRADVEAFWEGGRLLPHSNVQFGEGGAGTFSDGKLNTLVKDKYGRNLEVLKTFVRFGAKASILYEAKPHIGTDVLCRIVKAMREEIIRLGGQVRFRSQVTDIQVSEGHVCGVVINEKEEMACSQLVLAIGHSARDTFSMLYEKGLPMEAKAFAVGLRVEHLQEEINKVQYGMQNPGELGAAPYKVTARTSSGRGVYSFCMCPGGYVVNASSEEGRLAVNGMSYSGRDGRNANSAVIVSVTPADFGSEHPLAGIAFQRRLEEKAFRLGQGKIPVQRYGDFKRSVERRKEAGQETGTDREADMDRAECSADREMGTERPVPAQSPLMPQCKGLYQWADVADILPQECNEAFVEGMESFGRQIAGFDSPDTILSGVESRTSSPVRIVRDQELQSVIRGVYPCGEGAGYAGGITSAAMDGLRVAETIAAFFAPRITEARR